MEKVTRHSYEQLWDVYVKGSNYLGWIMCEVYTQKTNNFYWLRMIEKETLPQTLLDGYKNIHQILAEKGLIERVGAAVAEPHAPPVPTGNVSSNQRDKCPANGGSGVGDGNDGRKCAGLD